MAAQYPERTGYYDMRELFRLSSCVGFPGNLLVDGLKSADLAPEQNERVSESAIRNLLESKHLDQKLEKIFNHYPAYYNRKLFLKAMFVLRHKRLGFSEISMARVAFELYRSEDGAGMTASASVVLQALNMLGRVMSPIRLDSEIKKQQAVVDFPSRIQMYEFMDLAIRCAHSSAVEKEVESLVPMHSTTSTQGSAESGELMSLPDLDQLLMTKEERVCAHLDEQYRKSLYKKVKPAPPSSDTDHILFASRVHREESTAGSQRQLHVLVPALEHSQHQLFKARNGFTVLSKEQLQAAESLHNSRQSSRAGMRSNMASRVSHRAGSPRAGLNSDVKSKMRDNTGNGVTEVNIDSVQHNAAATSLPRSSMSSRAGPRADSNSVEQSPLKQANSPNGNKHTAAFDRVDKAGWLPEMMTPNAVEWLPKSQSVPILPSLQKRSGKVEVVVEESSGKRAASRSSNVFRLSSTSAFQFNENSSSRVAWEGKEMDTGHPVVSELDIQRHRGLIDELKWEELRRKWQQTPTKIQYRPRERSQTIL